MFEPVHYAPLPSIIDSSEGFLLPQKHAQLTKGVVILFHGITATPSEMRVLAEFLHARNYSLIVPRLSGHGKDVSQLKQTHYSLWLSDVERALLEAYKLLETSSSKNLYVIGLSLGSLLALYLATHFSVQQLKGVCAISTPYKLESPVKDCLLHAVSYMPDMFLQVLGVIKKSRRPQNYLAYHHNAFPEHSLTALGYLGKIRRMVSSKLRSLSCPILLLQDPFDHHLSLFSSQIIAQSVSSEVARIHFFPHGQHELPIGHSHAVSFEVICEFLEIASGNR